MSDFDTPPAEPYIAEVDFEPWLELADRHGVDPELLIASVGRLLQEGPNISIERALFELRHPSSLGRDQRNAGAGD